MSLELKFLREAVAKSEAIEVWRDRHFLSPKTLIGVPVFVGHCLVVLAELDDQFRYDGHTLFEVDSISRVRRGARDMALARREAGQVVPPVSFECGMGDGIADVLSALVASGIPAALRIERGGEPYAVVGVPLEVDEVWLRMLSWWTLGNRLDTETIVRVEDVTRVEIGSAYVLALAERYSVR